MPEPRSITMPALRILSLGWGVQSSTLACMVALGEIPPVAFAVHADTTWERQNTFFFARQMTPWLEARGVKVRTVQSPRTGVIQKWESRTEGIMAPVFTLSAKGDRGQLRRQCTKTWKVDPLRRFVALQLQESGIPKRPGAVSSLQGISQDEWRRMRTSDVAYITNEYPLVDLRMTRTDCIEWLSDHRLPIPVKSSCTFCPYHSRSEWKRMARTKSADWKQAVQIDEAIRNKRDGFELFVHPLRKPLPEAAQDDGQLDLWPESFCDGGYCFV